MVRYLMGGLVIGLLFGGGMNTILADENEVTISRTEYETLLQQVQDTKSDTEKILEILEGQQENVAKEGGEEEAVPSKRSGGGEVNDTNDNDSGEEGVIEEEEVVEEKEEVDKEVDKEEETETEDKEEVSKVKCKVCGTEVEEEYTKNGVCELCDLPLTCTTCEKETPYSELDENMNCKSCSQGLKDISTCDQCNTDYTEAEGHDCPMKWCETHGGFFDKDEHECFSQEPSDPSGSESGEGDQGTDASGSEDSGVVDGDVVEGDTAKPNKENNEEEVKGENENE